MVLYILDLFGTTVFATSSALAAGRRGMDLFGVLVVAGVTALGGGTVRDLLLDRHPVFWIDDLAYLVVAIAAAGATFLYTVWFQPPGSLLLIADAFGLAIFTVVGAQVAATAGAPAAVVVLMGMVTGIVGGIIRDVLCDDLPLVLREEIYAMAALAGGIAYVLLRGQLQPAALLGIASAIVFVSRLAGIYWPLHLPSFRVKGPD